MTSFAKMALCLTAVFFISTGIDCCRNQPILEFELTGILLEHADNGGTSLQVVAAETELSASAYAIRVESISEFISYTPVAGWGNSAHAISCDDEVETQDRFTSVQILAQNDFDADHPAGTDVSELFLGKTRDDNTQSFLPLNELPAAINQDLSNGAMGSFFLYLFEEPTPGEHRFEVRAQLEDGQILTATTTVIQLTL